MIYVACPYSHPDPLVREHRIDAAARTVGMLMQRGEEAFSPVVHGHAVVTRCKVPNDYAYWKSYCQFFVNVADSMIVLTMDGWKESAGLTAEIEAANNRGIPVAYLNEDGIV